MAALVLSGCGSVDRHPERLESSAYPASSKGVLTSVSREAVSQFPKGHSGFHLLEEAEEALQWRLALADHATSSIDMQYYLWNTDETGILLLSRVIDAADRGVRVRLLLDDFLFKGEEERLAALCHHPNVEVRIFNPQFARGGIASKLEVLLRFQQLNRRMHNKAFIVDNRFAILGGRNIGDEYFGLSQEYNFLDLDVLTVGPVIADASKSFDLFWNSTLAYPGEAFSPETTSAETPGVVAEIREAARNDRGNLVESPYPRRSRDWSREFAGLQNQWHTGFATLIDDAPTEEGEGVEGRFVEQAISRGFTPTSRELIFTSPYLIPNRQLHEIIQGHVDKGIEIRLLTAGMGSNNHLMVHSHYRKHRRSLLRDGVKLFEIREDAEEKIRASADVAPIRSDKLALHVKSGVWDRSRCFIGSLNLDPRSIDLNTENGLFIDSPGLSEELADHLEGLMDPDHSWEVSLEKGTLHWNSRDEEVTRQPAPDQRSRVMDFFFGLLPIQHLL